MRISGIERYIEDRRPRFSGFILYPLKFSFTVPLNCEEQKVDDLEGSKRMRL